MASGVFMSGNLGGRQVCLVGYHTDLSGRNKRHVTESGLPKRGASLKTATPERLSARERLLAAAQELFYEEGINTVGIDRVIERAGVAKASLYDCFGSKDELICAYLEAR